MKEEGNEIETLVINEQELDNSVDVEILYNKISDRYGRPDKNDHAGLLRTIDFLTDIASRMTSEEALEILSRVAQEHSTDPNFPAEEHDRVTALLQGPKALEKTQSEYEIDIRLEATLMGYHSPYPEVRSVTTPYDDVNENCETFRAYIIGIFWLSALSVCDVILSLRQPDTGIGSDMVPLVLAPSGKLWARVMPDWKFKIFGRTIRLNPGPWTYKEQVLATIMFTIGSKGSYATYIYILQKMPVFFGYKWVTTGYAMFVGIALQFIGFGFAGLMRRIAIYPERCLWQGILPTLAVNRVLVGSTEVQKVNGWTINRFKFFLIVCGLSFSWYVVCNVLFKGLHAFSWMTWIAPNNFNLAVVTGFYGGMGFSPINTVDWSSSGSNSLVTPFFSQVSEMVGRVIGGLSIIGMYYSNVKWSAYMPINSNELFANTGKEFNATKILTDGKFDKAKYQKYSPAYLSAGNLFVQGAMNAYLAILVCYIFVKDWRPVKNAFIGMYKGLRYRKTAGCEDFDDVHCKMMTKYPEVPDWWFLMVLLLSTVLCIILLKAYPEGTPVYSYFVVLAISFIWLIPTSLIYAVANVNVSLTSLFQIFASLMAKNNANAVLMIISFGYNTDGKTTNYINLLKASHYAKLPPRAVFRAQMLSAFTSIVLAQGIYTFQMKDFDNLCEWGQAQHFVCNKQHSLYSSVIQYGSFGVKLVYKMYPILPWCFLIGAFIGIFFAVTQKYIYPFKDLCRRKMSEASFEKFDKPFTRFARFWVLINPAIVLSGLVEWTGGTNLSLYVTGFYLSIIFMYYIKNYYPNWWQRYNYILEAGMDVGVAIGAVFDFFAFGGIMPYGPKSIKWWGNTVSTSGIDYKLYKQKAALKHVPKGGYFGLKPGSYPE